MTATSLPDLRHANPAANYERYFVPTIAGPLAEPLIDAAGLDSGDRLLDVACGTGVVARRAARRFGPALSVTAVDVHPAMLEAARVAEGSDGISWCQAPAEELPFPDESFDVVLCQMGLQFFSDRERAVREMRRVLAPGGRALINTPGPTPRLMVVLGQELYQVAGPEPAAFIDRVFSLHEPAELARLLTSAGFRECRAARDEQSLDLPAPADFLWQYLYSTPLADAAEALGSETRQRLEDDVIAAWAPCVDDGRLVIRLGVTTATGVR